MTRQTITGGFSALLLLAAASTANAADAPRSQSLSDQMAGLTTPSEGSAATNAEKVYVVQGPESGLGGIYEVQVGGGYNATSNVNLQSSEIDARFVYHATDRIFLALAGSKVKNAFTSSAQTRLDHDGIYPDVAFVKDRADATVGFNAIYGKARVTRDSVFYFNQYFALGGGIVDETNTAENFRETAAVGDVGVSFWFGHRVSFAVGAKDYRFKETRVDSASIVNHVVGYANAGLLLGGAG